MPITSSGEALLRDGMADTPFYVMLIKPARVFYMLTGLTLLVNGCWCGPGGWSELGFTRKKPKTEDLVGTWIPTSKTVQDMKGRGGCSIFKRELTLQDDGKFSMTNMPDWWRGGS